MQTKSVAALLVVAALAAPVAADAQAWSYPSFQPPRVATREFNFGVASASDAGTTLLFQWREETGPRNQLSLDVGIADPDRANADLQVFVGGQWAYQISRSGADVPLDFLFTAGAYLAGGDVTLFRFPFGLSLGHRFPLEGGVALTPYLHPRLSIDLCNDSFCDDETDLSLSFDLGVNVELTRTVALRAAAFFAGDNGIDDDGFGISLAWTPPSLARIIGRGR